MSTTLENIDRISYSNTFVAIVVLCVALSFVCILSSVGLNGKQSAVCLSFPQRDINGYIDPPKSRSRHGPREILKRFEQEWWKDPKGFELERRVIFSKARSFMAILIPY